LKEESREKEKKEKKRKEKKLRREIKTWLAGLLDIVTNKRDREGSIANETN